MLKAKKLWRKKWKQLDICLSCGKMPELPAAYTNYGKQDSFFCWLCSPSSA